MRWFLLGLIVMYAVVAAGSEDARAGKSTHPHDLPEIAASAKPDRTYATALDADTTPGAGVYAKHCAQCHEGQVAKAPSREWH